MPKLWSLLLSMLVLLASSSVHAREASSLAKDPALEASVVELAEELRCLVCQNETIAASQAELAVDLRNQIRIRLQKGESRAQILDYMVARYGEFVRYRPALSLTTALLWVGPFVLLALAAFVLASNIRRQRRSIRHDEPLFEQRRIERRPMSRRTRAALALALPVTATCLYMRLGSPQALSTDAVVQAPARTEPSSQDMDALVATFAKSMNERPPGRFEDLEGWVMLARTYASLKRFGDAATAFGKASALAPKDAQLLADWADVVAMQPGASPAREAASLVERALQLNPANLKALALAGSGAYERKDFAAAVQWWTKARALAPQAGEFAAGLDQSIAEARAAAVGQGSPVERAQP